MEKELEQILNINKTHGILAFKSDFPNDLAYKLRQAMHVAHKHNITPYAQLKGKIRIEILGMTVIIKAKDIIIQQKKRSFVEFTSASFNDLVGKFITSKDSYDAIQFNGLELLDEESVKLSKVADTFGFTLISTTPISLERKNE